MYMYLGYFPRVKDGRQRIHTNRSPCNGEIKEGSTAPLRAVHWNASLTLHVIYACIFKTYIVQPCA